MKARNNGFVMTRFCNERHDGLEKRIEALALHIDTRFDDLKDKVDAFLEAIDRAFGKID